jgi:hypothetical protein
MTKQHRTKTGNTLEKLKQPYGLTYRNIQEKGGPCVARLSCLSRNVRYTPVTEIARTLLSRRLARAIATAVYDIWGIRLSENKISQTFKKALDDDVRQTSTVQVSRKKSPL